MDVCGYSSAFGAIVAAIVAGFFQRRSSVCADSARVPDQYESGTVEFSLFQAEHYQEVYEKLRNEAWAQGFGRSAIGLGVAAVAFGSAAIVSGLCWWLFGASAILSGVSLLPLATARSQMEPLYRRQWEDTHYNKYIREITAPWPGLSAARKLLGKPSSVDP
jgi:hypothetical protein